MGKNNNTIIINGKSYDAQSGVLLSDAAVKAAAAEAAQKPQIKEVKRHKANHAKSHATQHSKTLMRHAVKKPSDSLKRHTKAQSGNGALAKSAKAVVITKAAIHKLDDQRLKNAKKVPKSQLITKFVPSSASTHSRHQAAIVVTPHHAKPLVSSTDTHRPKQSKTTADLLQQAIDRAHSHEQTYTPPKKKHSLSRRITSIGAISTAMIIILAVVASQGIRAVKLHVASSKAGFAVNAPSYQPAGFSLSGLTYTAGSAGLHFMSNSDDRAYSITEKTSSWDSNTLRDLVVAPDSQNYQTIEAAGRTIFLDSNKEATWVDKGILYHVNTEGVLNEQQLVKIADSL